MLCSWTKHNVLHFSCCSSQRLEIRAQVADAFLSKFQLTSDEMALLRGTRGGPVTEVRVLATKCSNYKCYREDEIFQDLIFPSKFEVKACILISFGFCLF